MNDTKVALPHNVALQMTNSSPALANARAGDRIEDLELNAIHILEIPVVAAANAVPVSVPAPCRMRIVDAYAHCKVASGSGTLTLRDSGGVAISSAIVCAVDKTISRVGTIDHAKTTVEAGALLQAIAAGANDRGVLVVLYLRLA